MSITLDAQKAAAKHFNALPSEIKQYIFDLETEVESAWQAHHVLLIVVLAFVAGAAVTASFL